MNAGDSEKVMGLAMLLLRRAYNFGLCEGTDNPEEADSWKKRIDETLTELRAALLADVQDGVDAGRYRWLRAQKENRDWQNRVPFASVAGPVFGETEGIDGDDLDAAIDSAKGKP
jgi:hypothetical protein